MSSFYFSENRKARVYWAAGRYKDTDEEALMLFQHVSGRSRKETKARFFQAFC
jgi:hypothetical protein